MDREATLKEIKELVTRCDTRVKMLKDYVKNPGSISSDVVWAAGALSALGGQIEDKLKDLLQNSSRF